MEEYYKLVNLIDEIALADKTATAEELDTIKTTAEKADISIDDFADANNCLTAENWEEVIEYFKHQFKTGERIAL